MFRLILILICIHSLSFGQNKIAEGKIVDSDSGQPVPFASIGLIGTTRGTSSNLNGEFSLSVNEAYAIRVSCLGYKTLEVENLSPDESATVKLVPDVTELNTVVVFHKRVNPKRIVQRAFNKIGDNYNTQPFFERFFYRHYCKDDSVYGRLIEASVDVWKRKGYNSVQSAAGNADEIRVTQLRRSFDKTLTAQGHVPIAVKSILQADVAGYQSAENGARFSSFSEISNLKTDIDNYTFSFEGITYYDGKEVYEISYRMKKDSILTTQGYATAPCNKGRLFITTHESAFVKFEEQRYWNADTIRTTTYYTPYKGKYYPYHLIREGESVGRDKRSHWFHVELMASEILTDNYEKFYSKEPGKLELLKIPYDSTYWNNNTTLKTTPLEDEIILDLGGGASLNDQFYKYQQYELNKIVTGNGDDQFAWYKAEMKEKKNLYIGFWSQACTACIQQMEAAKRMLKSYRDKFSFVWLSIDGDDTVWKKSIEKYNLAVEGFVHYRLNNMSPVAQAYELKEIPRYVLIDIHGNVTDANAKIQPIRNCEKDFDLLTGGNN